MLFFFTSHYYGRLSVDWRVKNINNIRLNSNPKHKQNSLYIFCIHCKYSDKKLLIKKTFVFLHAFQIKSDNDLQWIEKVYTPLGTLYVCKAFKWIQSKLGQSFVYICLVFLNL